MTSQKLNATKLVERLDVMYQDIDACIRLSVDSSRAFDKFADELYRVWPTIRALLAAAPPREAVPPEEQSMGKVDLAEIKELAEYVIKSKGHHVEINPQIAMLIVAVCSSADEFCRWVPDSGSTFEEQLRQAVRALTGAADEQR